MIAYSDDILRYIFCKFMNLNTYENVRCLDNLSKTCKRMKEIIVIETDYIVNKKFKYFFRLSDLIRENINLIIGYNYYNMVRNPKEYKSLDEYSKKIEEVIPYLTKSNLGHINNDICISYIKYLNVNDEPEPYKSHLRARKCEEAKRLYRILQKTDRNYQLVLTIPNNVKILSKISREDLLNQIVEWIATI